MRHLNCLGLPPFRNTNRPGAKYLRRKDRKARAKGFLNHAHLELFKGMLRAQLEVK